MSANTVLNPGVGGDTIKTDDLTTYKIAASKLVTGAATVDGGYVTATNPLPTGGSNIDSGNSSTATLLASATFTGTGIDVSGFASVNVNVFTNQAGTLKLEFSSDNTNWDDVLSVTIYASTFKSMSVPVRARYYRTVYTNGATNQGSFRLQTFQSLVHPSQPFGPTTGTQTSVAAATSDVTILAANAGRQRAIIKNESSATLYLLLASGTSSTSNYSIDLTAGESWVIDGERDYKGVVKGIWSGATGNARVTEWS